MTETAKYPTRSRRACRWRDDVISGKPPTLIGGAPGAGKTAFTMQAVVDALRITESLRAVVCNIEMPPTVLLDRQLARISGIDLTTIRRRRLRPEHAERIDQAMTTLEPLCERLVFVRPPFDLENVAATADDFEAGLLVLDYIQRISPPGKQTDRRASVDATMNHLRHFADGGFAVIVVAAVSRGKDSRGRSTYDADALNLASFRESSELEFGSDDAFILAPSANDTDVVVLKHLKSRNGECRDIAMDFNRPLQRFTPAETRPQAGMLRERLKDVWAKVPAASSPDEGGSDE